MLKFLALAALLLLPMVAVADKDEKKPGPLGFKMKGIDGKEVDLSKYKGKVVMFVNVASKCGLTKQYEQLQKLHEGYADKGLVIIGVPANEFGRQEPGTNEEIATFCKSEYGVKFPMLSKVVVKGKDICPLYKYLTEKETNPKFSGEIEWNFTKFLIVKGEIVNRFGPRVAPNDKKVIEAVEAGLKELEK
jgi:glutathione peroxidase